MNTINVTVVTTYFEYRVLIWARPGWERPTKSAAPCTKARPLMGWMVNMSCELLNEQFGSDLSERSSSSGTTSLMRRGCE